MSMNLSKSAAHHGAPDALHGQALVDQLEHGWRVLPNRTIFALVLAALRVRLMRSIVTMISIVLAIAFLAYMGLANQLYYNLAVESKRLRQFEPIAKRSLFTAATQLTAHDLISPLSVQQQRDLAIAVGMKDANARSAQLKRNIGPLRNAKQKEKTARDLAKNLAKKLNQKDPNVTKSDLAIPREDLRRAEEKLKQLIARQQRLEREEILAQWLSSGASENAKMSATLREALKTHSTVILAMAARMGRMEHEQLASLEQLLAVAAESPQTTESVTTLRKAIAQEYRKRHASRLDQMLRRAGINQLTTLKGNPTDTWVVFMALLTCTVGIANAMLMSVTERFREIGTMKCLGAPDTLVVKLFLLESAMLGVVGAGFGIVTGIVVALLAAVLQFGSFGPSQFPFISGLTTVGFAVLCGIALSVVGAVYPTLVASRMQPVDALRVEE